MSIRYKQGKGIKSVHSHVHAYIHICMHLHFHAHVHIYTCIHAVAHRHCHPAMSVDAAVESNLRVWLSVPRTGPICALGRHRHGSWCLEDWVDELLKCWSPHILGELLYCLHCDISTQSSNLEGHRAWVGGPWVVGFSGPPPGWLVVFEFYLWHLV